jgi:hypothetical protein
VVTDRYPTSSAATTFGQFGTTTHVITALGTITDTVIQLFSGDSVFEFGHNADSEYYREEGPEVAKVTPVTSLRDGTSVSVGDAVSFHTSSPSNPQTGDGAGVLDAPDGLNDPFLDVDFLAAS